MPFLPPLVPHIKVWPTPRILGSICQQNPAAPRNSWTCTWVVRTKMAQIAYFLLASGIHLPWVILKPKYLTSCGQICAFFFDTWYPASASSLSRALVPSGTGSTWDWLAGDHPHIGGGHILGPIPETWLSQITVPHQTRLVNF